MAQGQSGRRRPPFLSCYLAVVRPLDAARRVLPARIRRRLSARLFHWLHLGWSLPSGIRVRIEDYGDWDVYNEIFVNGVYDEAIATALRMTSGRPMHIVDLGGHVGFFSLRAVDRLRQRGITDAEIRITAIEADRLCGASFHQRMRDNGLCGVVRLVWGAVGEKAGLALFREAPAHFPHGRLSVTGERRPLTNSRGEATHEEAGAVEVLVPYVDLSSLLANVPRIDLLKCDIEGSELALIENYRDIFQKVEVAVFECHGDLCDIGRCQALLREYGFEHEAVFRPGELHFVYGVWR